MNLPSTGNVSSEICFFKTYSATLDLPNNIGRFSEITLQLKPTHGKFNLQILELKASQKMVPSPKQQIFVTVAAGKDIDTMTGTLDAFQAIERKTKILVTPSISEIEDQLFYVGITNHLD